MMIDSLYVLDPTATAITSGTTVYSTNILDLFANRDIGNGRIPAKLCVLITAACTSGTPTGTLNIAVLGAPDQGTGAAPTNSGGEWILMQETGTLGYGLLQTGYKAAQMDMAVLANATLPALQGIGSTASSTTVTMASSTAPTVVDGMYIFGSGILPGTTVTAGAGTTSLTISQAATTTVNNQLLTFNGGNVIPRYLQLRYTASTQLTAGSVYSFILLDRDDSRYYPPGIVVAN